MNNLFKAYSASELGRSAQIGDISPDRSVIVGKAASFFLYSGSNSYYEQYSDSHGWELGRRWAELDVQRRAFIGSNVTMQTIYVPNKASCLPDLYPLLLKQVPTPTFSRMRNLIKNDHAVIFCDALIEASKPELRHDGSPWRLVDTHWSEFGCLLTVNEILCRLGLTPISPVVETCAPVLVWGDLSRKFPGEPILEYRHMLLRYDDVIPYKIYDSGEHAAYEAHLGRRVTWHNPESDINLHVLLIGNSFSGIGTKPTEMTYWFSRRFRKVTFLHSQYLPVDVLDFYKPDLILFQGLERFMPSLPEDKFSASFIEDRYNSVVSK